MILNVHISAEDKCEDIKDRFYDKLKPAFHHFQKHHLKTLEVEFTAKVWRKDLNLQLGMRVYMTLVMTMGL
jgi:hypothetical protein